MSDKIEVARTVTTHLPECNFGVLVEQTSHYAQSGLAMVAESRAA
jgi:hypothetical protein